MDEGGLPHSRASQKNHFEHSLRTRTRLLQFRHKRPTYHCEFFKLTAFVLGLNTLPTWVCACSVLSHPTLLEGWGLLVCSNSLDERSRLQKERTHTNQLLHHTNRIASLWWKTQTSSVARLAVCSYLWLSPASAKSLLESKNVHVKSEAE